MADWAASQWVDFSPATGGTVVIPSSDARTPIRVCLNQAGLLAALTLSWPVTGVMDGQLIAVNSNAIVTLLTHVVTGGTMRGGGGALLAGPNGIYCFRQSNSTWYKFS